MCERHANVRVSLERSLALIQIFLSSFCNNFFRYFILFNVEISTMNCKKFCKNGKYIFIFLCLLINILIILAARIVQDFVRSFAEILWRFAEVHLPKLVLLILIIIASKNICVLNLVVVILISLAVCLPSLVGIISLLVAVYLSLATITRVVFLVNSPFQKLIITLSF